MALPTAFLPTPTHPLRLLSLFSGIGAFERALENLHIPFSLISYCEIDRTAARAYSLLHNVPESMNLVDVTTVDTSLLPRDIDLIIYGFPCQDISLAGKKRGFTHEDGSSTRSGLFFEALRIIKDTQPKIAIAENVKNLTGDGFKKEFEVVLSSLFDIGYNSFFCVLNSKDFGVPQNRERVFIVSVRRDIPYTFTPPSGFPLTLCLRDILEPNVSERFYLSDAMIRNISGFGPTRYEMNPEIDREVANTIVASSHKIHRANEDTFVSSSFESGGGRVSIKKGYPELLEREESKPALQQLLQLYPNTGNPQAGRVYSDSGISPTLDTAEGGNRMPKVIEPTPDSILVHEGTSIGYTYAEEGDSINYERVLDNNRRGRVGKGIFNTILAESSMGVAVRPENTSSPLRVRRLTPGECFRLMGFRLEDSQLLSSHGISNTQLYHMAGNSIVVDVLMEIFKEIYISKEEEL